MAGIIFGGIAPHGFSIIGEIAGDEFELFKPIREGMEEFGRRIKKHSIDTIIVLTPHGLRVTGHSAIYTTAMCRGSLSQFGKTMSTEYTCDQDMSTKLYNHIKEANIPVVGCNFGAMSGNLSNIPMDWGTLIPLWFSGAQDEIKPQLVVIGPTRDTSYDNLVKMGEIINDIAIKSNKRIALIASADQGHCHDENGPYGYTKESKILDEKIIEIVKSNNFEALYQIDKDLIDKGKPDSIWQMLILHGALKDTSLKSSFITYECPTYFGMLVATYE